jgi:virulence-associated protein VagC
MNNSVAVRLPLDLVENAKRVTVIYNRSIPKQIEYWAKIGKIAEENPDLPMNFIKGILEAREQENIPFTFIRNR